MPVLLALLTAATAWVWPLAPPVTVARGFDPPTSAYGPGHRGVDLVGVVGAPVRAAGGGLITVAGPVAGRGVVVVLHGSLRTTYEPVRATVRVGAVVAAGERIGVLVAGHPGCPAAACLHWGLLRGRTYLDPLSLVGRGRVRLLPLDGSLAIGLRQGRGMRSGLSRAPAPTAAPGGADARAFETASSTSREAARPTGSAATTAAVAESALAVGIGLAALRRTRCRRARAG